VLSSLCTLNVGTASSKNPFIRYVNSIDRLLTVFCIFIAQCTVNAEFQNFKYCLVFAHAGLACDAALKLQPIQQFTASNPRRNKGEGYE